MPEATAAPALPDHLSSDPRSPHHNAAVFEHDIGIRFNGQERFDVQKVNARLMAFLLAEDGMHETSF